MKPQSKFNFVLKPKFGEHYWPNVRQTLVLDQISINITVTSSNVFIIIFWNHEYSLLQNPDYKYSGSFLLKLSPKRFYLVRGSDNRRLLINTSIIKA